MFGVCSYKFLVLFEKWSSFQKAVGNCQSPWFPCSSVIETALWLGFGGRYLACFWGLWERTQQTHLWCYVLSMPPEAAQHLLSLKLCCMLWCRITIQMQRGSFPNIYLFCCWLPITICEELKIGCLASFFLVLWNYTLTLAFLEMSESSSLAACTFTDICLLFRPAQLKVTQSLHLKWMILYTQSLISVFLWTCN